MYEHRLYLDMAAACIDSLTHEERTSVPPNVFAKLVKVCSTVAHGRIPEVAVGDTEVPVPPTMGFVKAYMLKPGDCVWRRNAAFTIVESVLIEHTGPRNAVYVCWTGLGGSESTSYGYEQPARIAMNRADAQEWNARRVGMPNNTVDQLVSIYGGRRGG